MNEEDLRRIRVAAADKEAAAFELDHAALTLEEAVVAALRHGQPPALIAEAADLPEPEVALLSSASASDAGNVPPLTE
jgi:hypothetical protein